MLMTNGLVRPKTTLYNTELSQVCETGTTLLYTDKERKKDNVSHTVTMATRFLCALYFMVCIGLDEIGSLPGRAKRNRHIQKRCFGK